MAEYEEVRFDRFDQVRLRTTKNVKYLSAPPGTHASPQGLWSVAGVVAGELLLVKYNIIIRIPATDVLKIESYDVNDVTRLLGRLTDGED
jgi:hypothetical protein